MLSAQESADRVGSLAEEAFEHAAAGSMPPHDRARLSDLSRRLRALSEHIVANDSQRAAPDYLVCEAGDGMRIRCTRCNGLLTMSPMPLSVMGDMVALASKVHAECREKPADTEPKQSDPPEALPVEIVGPDGRVHYRRPERHPDTISALMSTGYSVRRVGDPGYGTEPPPFDRDGDSNGG